METFEGRGERWTPGRFRFVAAITSMNVHGPSHSNMVDLQISSIAIIWNIDRRVTRVSRTAVLVYGNFPGVLVLSYDSSTFHRYSQAGTLSFRLYKRLLPIRLPESISEFRLTLLRHNARSICCRYPCLHIRSWPPVKTAYMSLELTLSIRTTRNIKWLVMNSGRWGFPPFRRESHEQVGFGWEWRTPRPITAVLDGKQYFVPGVHPTWVTEQLKIVHRDTTRGYYLFLLLY